MNEMQTLIAKLRPSQAYNKGFDAGWEYAVGRAFGVRAPSMPDFDTAEDANNWQCGVEDGYASVDD